jgi:hypothetical protein
VHYIISVGVVLIRGTPFSFRTLGKPTTCVYTKAGGNLNSTNRRRMIIPVNDDDADAWVDDFSYHDTTSPRPEPILPKRICHIARGATQVAKKRKATSQQRKNRRLSAPQTMTNLSPGKIQPQAASQAARSPSTNTGKDATRRTHQNLPLLPRFIGDCREAGFPNPLSHAFQCLHGYY